MNHQALTLTAPYGKRRGTFRTVQPSPHHADDEASSGEGNATMDETSIQQAGEIAAITIVVRQILARLPQTEQDEIRAFANGRLSVPGGSGEEIDLVVTAAQNELDNLFTAAIPE